jgi:diguanylate cyclase (GGDEF)-like protein
MGAAQFAGIAWPVHRWVTGFFVFSTIHVAVWLTGVGLIGNLMVLNIGLAAFALMLVLVARRLPKEDHRLGRPLIMILSAATALAQIVRLFLIFYRGWGDEKWMPLSATMIVGATVIAAFGVACIIILVAERFAAQIRREARTDPLTGLAMRRVFDDQIEAELARWRRYRRQFAVVLFDIDHFKRVNDAHGHDVGDEALRHVARCGTTAIRPSDLLVRLGGDEFALILPESAVKDALEVSGRLLGALRETPLKLPSGHLILTGSFGVAAAQSVDDTVEQIVKRADEALYLVKRQGRNGVAALPQAPLEALHDAPVG